MEKPDHFSGLSLVEFRHFKLIYRISADNENMVSSLLGVKVAVMIRKIHPYNIQ